MAIGFNPLLYSVDEDAGVVTFTVQNRNPDLEREVTVQFTTTDGTATGVFMEILIHCVEWFKVLLALYTGINNIIILSCLIRIK